ncbi:MAG: membrane dipeptidase [Actinobacteria bacterium]|nr:membrane dipeptidase [Actinomycetota bacterium]
MIVIDFHLDLGMNALRWNRELIRPVPDLRAAEAGLTDEIGRAAGTVALPELRRGNVALLAATANGRTTPAWREAPARFAASQEIAFARAAAHLAYYRALELRGQFRPIRTRPELDAHLTAWGARGDGQPLGYLLAIEGSDPMLSPAQLEWWWNEGLRAASLAHNGEGFYAGGTGAPSGLKAGAVALLRAMESRGVALDLTHCSDRTFAEALDHFHGPVFASHSTCRALVPGPRQLTDDQIRAIAARDGVVGLAFDNSMLHPAWRRAAGLRAEVSMTAVVDHLDHICQLVGDGDHAGIGSDLDGAFGVEQCPRELDTIADLQRFPEVMAARGYGDAEIARFMYGNWQQFLRRVLPAA